MRGRQPLDVRKRRDLRLPDHIEEKKIGNRKVVEPFRGGRMTSETIERIADDYKLANASVEKRFNAKMIARAKQLFVTGVPKRKGKISQQTIYAPRAPCRIRPQDQFAVRRVRMHRLLCFLKLVNQLFARVQPRVCHDPKVPVEAQGLPVAFRFLRRPQKRVTHSYRTIHPRVLAVWAAKGKKCGERLQQRRFDRSTVPMHDANEPAQSIRPFANRRAEWR